MKPTPPPLKRVEATASHGPGALQLPDKVCPGLQDQSLHPKTHVLRGEQRTRRPLAGSINWEFGWWDFGLWPFLVGIYIYILYIYIIYYIYISVCVIIDVDNVDSSDLRFCDYVYGCQDRVGFLPLL